MSGNRKVIAFSVALSMIMSLMFQPVFAASSDFDNLSGTGKSGKVKISVESYQEKNGQLVSTPNLVRIKAGDKTSYIPIITNKGSECSLRLRVYAKTKTQKINILKYCYGWEDNWTKKSNWFYYKKKFEKGESVQICQGFDFPEEWLWRVSNVMGITIEAEAVADEKGSGSFIKTGDDTDIMKFVIVGLGCLCIMALVRRKYGDKNL